MNCPSCSAPIEWDGLRNVALTAESDFWEIHRCPAPPAGVVNECICGELVVLRVVPHGEAPRLDWPALTEHTHLPRQTMAEQRVAAARKPIPPVSRGAGSSPVPGGATPPRRVSPQRAPTELGLPE